MKKTSLLAFASIMFSVLYWLEYSACLAKSRQLDENFLEITGRQSLFSDHFVWFTSVGFLLPSGLLFSVIISFVCKINPSELDDHVAAVPLIGYIVITLIVLFSMILMVPSLFDQAQPGILMKL